MKYMTVECIRPNDTELVYKHPLVVGQKYLVDLDSLHIDIQGDAHAMVCSSGGKYLLGNYLLSYFKSADAPEDKMSTQGKIPFFSCLVKTNGSDWRLYPDCCSVKDLVIQVADHYGNNTPLFAKALKGCDGTDAIELYNIFADPFSSIEGIWKLDEHIFGDTE